MDMSLWLWFFIIDNTSKTELISSGGAVMDWKVARHTRYANSTNLAAPNQEREIMTHLSRIYLLIHPTLQIEGLVPVEMLLKSSNLRSKVFSFNSFFLSDCLWAISDRTCVPARRGSGEWPDSSPSRTHPLIFDLRYTQKEGSYVHPIDQLYKSSIKTLFKTRH